MLELISYYFLALLRSICPMFGQCKSNFQYRLWYSCLENKKKQVKNLEGTSRMTFIWYEMRSIFIILCQSWIGYSINHIFIDVALRIAPYWF